MGIGASVFGQVSGGTRSRRTNDTAEAVYGSGMAGSSGGLSALHPLDPFGAGLWLDVGLIALALVCYRHLPR